MPKKADSFDQKQKEFQVAYANAMARWAQVEGSLAMIFSMMAGITPALAYSLYYSLRSFDARVGLFKSAIPHSKLPKKDGATLRAFANKARALAAFRNTLAHGSFSLNMNRQSPTFGELILTDGKYQFQSDEVKSEGLKSALTKGDLIKLDRIFVRLDNVLNNYWADRFSPGRHLQPSRYRARVLAIPIPQFPKPTTPTPSTHQRKPKLPSRKG